MKRILTAVLALSLTATAASADIVCQTVYVTRWKNYGTVPVLEPGPQQCYETGQPDYAPPPVVYQNQPPVVYEQPYPDAGAALVGGLIGAGIGYAIGKNNNHGHKNNYYYYNNGGGHKHYRYPGGWNNGEGRPGHKNRQQPIGDGD